MKILVVDDDIVARKVLGAFLKQSNYEMQIVEDGHSAFRALTAPGAPLIAIVDWVMPDLTGPELCTKLRQHDFPVQPYLLMLSGRKEKSDIAIALDAGADDFISKPFNIQETQARLRVAVRAIERQLALRRQLDQLREQLRMQRALARSSRNSAQPGSTDDARPIGLGALEFHQLDTIVGSALQRIGLMETPLRQSIAPRALEIVAWTSLLLLKERQWVDLFLEIEDASLSRLMAQAGGDANAPAIKREAFAATFHTALRDALLAALRTMGVDVEAPLPTRALTGSDGSPRLPEEVLHRHPYQAGDGEFTLSFAAQRCPLREKTTGQLQLLDVLAQPYPPASTHQVPLLRAGVVLNEQLIEKLQLFTNATAVEVPPILVHTPSPVALHYQLHSTTAMLNA
jgi:DNA-binding response OmpR family regulator